MNRQRRNHGVALNTEQLELSGTAALFGVESVDLGGYVEVIEPGAFRKAIRRSDALALFQHNPNIVLGRQRAGTLRLWEDSVGLRFEVPNVPRYRRDVVEAIQRGDVRGCSFSFTVDRDRYEKRGGRRVRVVESVRKLYDVSVVLTPAYPGTRVAVVPRARPDDPEWMTAARNRRRALDLAAVA